METFNAGEADPAKTFDYYYLCFSRTRVPTMTAGIGTKVLADSSDMYLQELFRLTGLTIQDPQLARIGIEYFDRASRISALRDINMKLDLADSKIPYDSICFDPDINHSASTQRWNMYFARLFMASAGITNLTHHILKANSHLSIFAVDMLCAEIEDISHIPYRSFQPIPRQHNPSHN